MRRVVVTGMGVLSPLGASLSKTWDQILKAKSGISKLDSEKSKHWPVRIAGKVKDFIIDDWVPKKDQKKMGRFIHLAIAAARQAVKSAGIDFKNKPKLTKNTTEVIIGVGLGALDIIEAGAQKIQTNPRLSPFFVPSIIANSASGYISIEMGIKGGNFSTVSACASGAHAIGTCWEHIKQGTCDIAIAGGTESVLSALSFYGFHAMRALSTRNEEPQKASRPWDRDRNGFVLSEGAAVLILEEEQKAKKRGAKIYAELLGYGISSDAHHIAAPEPEGKGAALAMQNALASANIPPDQIQYINAHGTSTPLGDLAEVKAITKVFKEHSKNLCISSTKSMIGHTLGAAGAIESVFSILSLEHQVVPPTINLDNRDSDIPALDFVPHQARPTKIQTVLNNSFGFGGTNVSLVFQRYSS